VASCGITEFTRKDQTLERFFLSARSIRLTKTLLDLAGVLLGKTSLNSLYGLMGCLPQTLPLFEPY
jgi:hypothetical protein